jgi:pyridoxine 5-phosphate synthase
LPERRQELTTEGGLDVAGNAMRWPGGCGVARGRDHGEPLHRSDARQVDAAAAIGAPTIELHTGAYASTRVRR